MLYCLLILQVRWHPDRQYEEGLDEQSRLFAGELSRLVNDAMDKTRVSSHSNRQ